MKGVLEAPSPNICGETNIPELAYARSAAVLFEPRRPTPDRLIGCYSRGLIPITKQLKELTDQAAREEEKCRKRRAADDAELQKLSKEKWDREERGEELE